MNRRNFLTGTLAGLPLLGMTGTVREAAKAAFRRGTVSGEANLFVFICPELKKPVRDMLIGYSHISDDNSRGDPYKDYSKRMGAAHHGQWESFSKSIDRARKEAYDLILLAGDILSFPTELGVEKIKAKLDSCGIPWLYVSGNHDWHYEGVSGSDEQQRAEWAPKRLAPLYQGESYLMASRLVQGIRFVMIDNSIYKIMPEQLDFLRKELAHGDPTVLTIHIPLYLSGTDIFTCGNPRWNETSDPYWQIERREPWDKAGQGETTFAFRREALSAPNMLAVLAGHTHRMGWGSESGAVQLVTPANGQGSAFLDLTFTP